MELWSAILNPHSPRYAEWLAVLGTDSVPLLSPSESLATLGAQTDVPIYRLDVAKLTHKSRRALVVHIARKFQAPESEVNEQLETQGFPIRAEDVIVAFSLRAFV